MRWRDIRFERPTEADADDNDEVLCASISRNKYSTHWSYVDQMDHFWCPLSELPDPPDRIPDPPEDWRFLGPGESLANPCQIWDARIKQYRPRTYPHMPPMPNYVYIVPIDPPAPPEPQYRPFANAAEFDGWACNFWRYKDDLRSVRRSPMSYSDDGHYGDKWDVSLVRKEFADGTPFGVRVDQ